MARRVDRAKTAVVTARKIAALLRQVRLRPWREVPWRTRRVLTRLVGNWVERNRVNRNAAAVTPKQLERSLNRPLGEAVERAGRIPLGRMHASGPARRDLARQFQRVHPWVYEAILAEAENACAHRFDLLGSGLTDLGPTIDWSRDFKSGFRWPRQYVKDMVLVDPSRGADVKVPWDLSRGYQLVRLGQAYWLTDEERFARELMAQWSSWVDENPVLQTCNWGNAMEAAIRVANWCVAFTLSRDAAAQTPRLRERFLGAALEHGRFIAANLERFEGYPTSNHYLSDLVGLVYLGVLTPDLTESREWLEIGRRGLEGEALVQVGADGFDYEGSTNYHRLVGELLLSAFTLARQNGFDVAEPAWKRAVAMAEATLACTRPDGRAPLIGDVDNGRLHWLTPEPPDDHRSLLGLAAVSAGRADFHKAAGRARAEGFWWGEEPASAPPATAPRSRHFETAGLVVLRSHGTHVVVHCGAPRGPRGHFHNDSLSFEACLLDLAWIVDPGTYAYTSSEADRNHFRRTAAHNTVQVDGIEINAIVPGQLFDLPFQCNPRVVEWTSTPERDCFIGEHEGFSRLAGVGRHRRTITLGHVTGDIEVIDEIAGEGEHDIETFLHLDPGVRGVVSRNRVSLTRPDSPREVEIVFFVEGETGGPGLAEDWVARGYGKREKATVIRTTARTQLPWRRRMTIGARP
ncbi:MAG: heparinase II/III family protein [Vicinamibacteria bacterium]|nr:heparinase II/III family protein [Vicinamibacteria bacterium]